MNATGRNLIVRGVHVFSFLLGAQRAFELPHNNLLIIALTAHLKAALYHALPPTPPPPTSRLPYLRIVDPPLNLLSMFLHLSLPIAWNYAGILLGSCRNPGQILSWILEWILEWMLGVIQGRHMEAHPKTPPALQDTVHGRPDRLARIRRGSSAWLGSRTDPTQIWFGFGSDPAHRARPHLEENIFSI